MNDNIKWWYSWPLIFISAIIFCPITIVLIILRIKNDKGKNGAKIVSYILFIGAVSGVVASLNDEFTKGEVALLLVLIIVGGILNQSAKKINPTVTSSKSNTADRYNKYANIILNYKQYSLSIIASMMSLSEKEVMDDLSNMLKSGLLPGYYINYKTNEIVSPESRKNFNANQGSEENSDNKVVTCPNCGAPNIFKYGESECEYCGSPL